MKSILGPILLILGSMVSLTSGAALAKSLFEMAGPGGVTVMRVGIGALILCLFWRPWKFKISKVQFKFIFLYGLCLGTMNLLFYYAIARLPIGLAIAIEFLGPLSIALLYSKRKLDFLWALLAALGIALILPLSQFSEPLDLIGVLFALAAALMWALYIVLSKKAGAGSPAGAVTSLGMLIAFFAVAPFGFKAASVLFTQSSALILAVGVGLLSSAVPYSLEMLAIKKIPEKYFGLLMSMEPAVGAISGFIFLNENLSKVQLFAIACVILASVGSSYSHHTSIVEPTPQ